MTIDLALLGNFIIGFVSFLAIVAGAAVYIRSAIRKEQSGELEDLAETRGKTIQDLREKLNRYETALAKLEARVEYLENREIDKIVEGVVEGVVNHPRFK